MNGGAMRDELSSFISQVNLKVLQTQDRCLLLT